MELKLDLDPIRQHQLKQLGITILAAVFAVAVWLFVAKTVFGLTYQLDSLATTTDTTVLTNINAEIDQTLDKVKERSYYLEAGRNSFGNEVVVRTAQGKNPFVPLFQVSSSVVGKPAKPLERKEEAPQFYLAGLAKIGARYLAILADASGASQVVGVGDRFAGWTVQRLGSNRVELSKEKQSLTLVWEEK